MIYVSKWQTKCFILLLCTWILNLGVHEAVREMYVNIIGYMYVFISIIKIVFKKLLNLKNDNDNIKIYL